MRHFNPHFQGDWDDSHRVTSSEEHSRTEETPDPELVTCERCKDWMRSKGIRTSIADREPINMDAVPVSPFNNWMG